MANTPGSDFNSDFNNDFGPAKGVLPSGGPTGFNPGSEWQLLDRLSEPKPEMPQLPWL